MDADTKELAEYYSGKSTHAVTDDLGHLEKVIERAQRLADTLSDNGSLSWRCAVDRCLARGGNPTAKACRACTAHETSLRLVKELEELREERVTAAGLARELRQKRYPGEALD